MSRRRRLQKNLEFGSGIISLLITLATSQLIFGIGMNKIVEYEKHEWIEYIFLLLLSYAIVFFSLFSPINLLKRSKPMEFVNTIRNCLLTYGVFGSLLILTKNPIIESRYMFLFGLILYCLYSLIIRYAVKKLLLNRIAKSKAGTMVGIISTYDRAKEFLPKLKLDWTKEIKGVALIDSVCRNNVYKCMINDNSTKVYSIDDVPVVANMDNLLGWIRTASLDEVFINLPYEYTIDFQINELIEELEDMGIVVNINLPSIESVIENSKYDNLNCIVKSGYPMAVFSPTTHSETKLFIKNIADFVGGLLGTVVSLPIILVTAIPLLLESKGPLIFKQQRVGKNGRIFNIYKLRSMYVDAEERKKQLMEQNKMDGHMFKMDNDPRITKVGKFIRKYSIDELPQFWNVLKGDMSLVGTRPPTIDEFEKYESHHKRRLSMKPGITGMWQVSGRSDIKDFEEVVRLDCEYIDDWSLALDIKILFKTVGVVLTHKGAE